MRTKRQPPDTDHWIADYRTGVPLYEVAKRYGASDATMRRWLAMVGVPIRSAAQSAVAHQVHERGPLPYTDQLVQLYTQGVSEQRLAVLNGVARNVIRRHLREAGVVPRNLSESMYVRMAHTSAEERQRLTAAAHATQRGVRKTWDTRCRMADGRQRVATQITAGERLVAQWLREAGFEVTPQRAIGPYNVDLALNANAIAVEIFGGNYHASGRHAARMLHRTKYLLDQGWSLLIIWTDGRRYPLSPAVAQHCIALTEVLGRDPPTGRAYWVVRGNGEPAPRLASYFNDDAFVEALCDGLQLWDSNPLAR